MKSSDRLKEKHRLFVKLGALFGPLQRLVSHANEYDEQERAETIARYCAEYFPLSRDFAAFCKGQPGHEYSIQASRFSSALNSVITRLDGDKPLESVIPDSFERALAAIDEVPIPRTSVILEAGSPFTAYCRLRELCEMDATLSLQWIDPYFDVSVFYRYLDAVRPGVPVTLVAAEPGPHAGKRHKERWANFLDVSRLYAQERGPSAYRLVVNPAMHDRWIVFDRKRIYSLGGSAKDAANHDYFTITHVEATPANLSTIDTLTASGTEFFGPNVAVHL